MHTHTHTHVTCCVYVNVTICSVNCLPQVVSSVRARFKSNYQNSSILAVSGSNSLLSRFRVAGRRDEERGDGGGGQSLPQQGYSRSRHDRYHHHQLLHNGARLEARNRVVVRESLGEINSVDCKYVFNHHVSLCLSPTLSLSHSLSLTHSLSLSLTLYLCVCMQWLVWKQILERPTTSHSTVRYSTVQPSPEAPRPHQQESSQPSTLHEPLRGELILTTLLRQLQWSVLLVY